MLPLPIAFSSHRQISSSAGAQRLCLHMPEISSCSVDCFAIPEELDTACKRAVAAEFERVMLIAHDYTGNGRTIEK